MSAEHMDAHGAIDPTLTLTADEALELDEIPEDFVPTDRRWSLSQRVGVITGGALLVLNLVLLAYGMGLSS